MPNPIDCVREQSRNLVVKTSPLQSRVWLVVLLLSALVGCGSQDNPALPPKSGVTRVWGVDDGEKVKRNDLSHWAASSADNAVWDGSTVRLFGARNEVVAFQLILEAAGSGAGDVNVLLDSLRGPGYTIANRSTTDDPFNFVGRHIELFLEHYVNVTQRSLTGLTGAWSSARPLPDSDHLGWIPDALIPFQATPGTADWIGGAPFAIGAGRNQGVWVDITIPRDAPQGTYRSTVRVTENGRQTFAVPLELVVYSFTLPDSTHFHNMFVVKKPLLSRHPGISFGSQAYWQLFQKYMHLAHRHRMDLTDGQHKVAAFDAYLKDYYTGVRYSPAFGYDGPGRGVGNTTYSIGTYDQPDNGQASGFDPVTREAWWAAADAWEGWFRSNAPDVVRFKYMVDEPVHDTTAFYPIIRERAGWLKSNPGIGKDLLVYCTVKMDPRLDGLIDFWSLTGQTAYDEGDGILAGYVTTIARDRQARGEKVAIYNSNRPSYGIFEWIDNVATDPRVIPWVSRKYNVDQYFLWETGYAYTMTTKRNPWVTPYQAYSGGKVIWGLGSVLYTGNDDLFPDESRGIDGPIASIRMKNWRRGQQDYEYLHLAHKAGIDTRSLVDGIVPAAFDDYKGDYTSQRSQAAFAERGFKFENARQALAIRISQNSK